MSVTSMFTAVSGMNVNAQGLAVVGDNVANMNTHGFKSGSIVFGDIVSQTLGSSGIGRGALVNEVGQEFTQGAFENTPNVLDLAVDGDGLFVISKGNDTFYTRAGQFGIDKQGFATNPDGYTLQGYQFTVGGASSTVVADINVASINSQPQSTNDVTIYANLDSRTDITTTANPVFDETDAATTSHFTSTITVFDSLGNSHVVNVYYRKNTESATGNQWQWFAVVGASDTASGNPEIQGGGLLNFNANGALVSEASLPDADGATAGIQFNAGSGNPFTVDGGFNFAGGASLAQSIAFDFGDSTSEGGNGLEGSTQFGSTSTTAFLNQDGYSAGTLKSLTIDDTGLMSGVFTNGQTKSIAQVVLAKFISQESLIKQGKGLYAESFESGQPIVTAPGNSGTGGILANTLELSNVDLAAEFVKMIIMQRGFQANSRIVSTSDELLQELVNLKR